MYHIVTGYSIFFSCLRCLKKKRQRAKFENKHARKATQAQENDTISLLSYRTSSTYGKNKYRTNTIYALLDVLPDILLYEKKYNPLRQLIDHQTNKKKGLSEVIKY